MKRQRGVALITAVMVVAFASTVGAGLLVNQNLAVHRTANLIAQDQAWWYLVGLEEWATTLLDRDREDNNFDHLDELWAQPIDFLPVDEGALSGRLEDLQGKFNLNSLRGTDEATQARRVQFLRLLRNIPDLRQASPEGIGAAIIDWIDANTEPGFPGGAEDSVYLGRERPYRAANRVPESLSELLLIEGIDHKVYTALVPHLTIHPGDHRINVNTATPPVLTSLSEELSPIDVEGLIAEREQGPWETIDAFLQSELLAGKGLKPEDVNVQSEYFQAFAAANIGNVRLTMVSLLERKSGGKTRALSHSRNTL